MPNTITRRAFLQTASVVSLGALLAACAPQQQPAPKAEPTKAPQAPAAAQPQPAAKGPVTLILHMRAGGEKSEAPMYVTRVEEFMKANPNIKVELGPIPGGEYFAKVQTMAAAGTLGDTMWTADVWTEHTRFVKLNVIATVDEFLDKYKVSKKEWIPAVVDTLTHQGKMYGLPKCGHPGYAFLFYNEELFDKAGLKKPELMNTTPENVTEWAQKLAEGPKADRQVFAYRPNIADIMAIVNGGRAFGTYENNDEGTKSLYDAPEWTEWMKWVAFFYKENLAPLDAQLPSGGAEALFASGKLAMFTQGRWNWKAINLAVKNSAKPIKWNVVMGARKPNAKGWVSCVDTHSATKFSKHPDEAFQLIYAMADKRFAELVSKEIGYLTARVDDVETIKPHSTPWLELQYKAMTMTEKFRQPANARGREVESLIKNELDKVWLGKEEPKPEFMKQIKTQVDELLAKPF